MYTSYSSGKMLCNQECHLWDTIRVTVLTYVLVAMEYFSYTVYIFTLCFRLPCWNTFLNWWTAYTWFRVCLNITTPQNTWHRSLWRSLIKWWPQARLISVKGWRKSGTWTGWSCKILVKCKMLLKFLACRTVSLSLNMD